jgi:spore coat protein U-like protein
MSTFIRTTYPFKVQASIDSATPDFKVSTNGTTKATTLVVTGGFDVSGSLSVTDLNVGTTGVFGAIKVPVTVSGSVSVKVTAAGFITIFDLAGTEWRVPCFTTLA